MKQISESLELGSKDGRGRERYSFLTADGVSSKDELRKPELLLLDETEVSDDSDVLVVEANYGVLGILGDYAPRGDTTLFTTSDRRRRLIERNMERNGIDNSRAVLSADIPDADPDVAVYGPREDTPVDVAKRNVARALDQMEQGTELYVAGDKYSGITRMESFLENSGGKLEKLAQAGGQRVYRYKNGEDVPEEPGVERSFTAEALGEEASFRTREGLFSAGELDDGTRLLIESFDGSGKVSVLDLGCGYGAVSVFLGKKHGLEVTASDDDAVAAKYAERNLEENGVREFKVSNTDCTEGMDGSFDAVVSNPPTHAGSDITDEMVSGAYSMLERGGELWMVFNRNVHLEEKMQEEFGGAEKISGEGNFVVYRSRK
ncbi:MAG: class I SAM-dependent methyltransferase [Candidatus Nanohaloarchaea archaeon]